MKTPDNNRVLYQLAKIVEETLADGFTIEELAGAISTGVARFRKIESSYPSATAMAALVKTNLTVNSERLYAAISRESEKVTPLTGYPSGIIFLQGEIQNCDYCGRFSKKSPQPDCNLHGFNGSLTRERAWQETHNKANWPEFRSANNKRPGYCICEYVTDGEYWLVNPTCPAHHRAAKEAMRSGMGLHYAKDEFFTAAPDFGPNGASTSVLSQIQAGSDPVKPIFGISAVEAAGIMERLSKQGYTTGPALGNLAAAAKEAAEAVAKVSKDIGYPVDKDYLINFARQLTGSPKLCSCNFKQLVSIDDFTCPIHGAYYRGETQE